MDRNGQNSLSVVVPAHNEESTLARIVEKVITLRHLREVIVVDDASTDQTGEIGRELAGRHAQVQYVRHDHNLGKTEALRTGFALTHGEIVIIQDADLEYDPGEIRNVVAPIVEGRADVVYGSRFLVRRATRVLYFYHYLANKALTFTSNLLTNLNMTDVETGYKAFRGDVIRSMVITSEGFGFEIEVTAKVAKLGCAIYEVPISYYGRTYEEGKKISLRDGLLAFWLVFKFNLFSPLRKSYERIPEFPAKGQAPTDPGVHAAWIP
ncbi:MAG TPA: glycosyltransferase family 2 protein [Thermoleophilaceae bacterium]|nr:glycosyltransferase family 2 protein [Thermoleophilaceae bacterium]